MRTARADFEEARNLLPNLPDPHLGLALIYMSDGDLDKAEAELNEAKRNRFVLAGANKGIWRTVTGCVASAGWPVRAAPMTWRRCRTP